MKEELFEYKIDNDDTELSENVTNKLDDKLETDLSNFPEGSKAKLKELLGITESEATASGSAFERE